METNHTDNNRMIVKIIVGIAILAVAGLAIWRLESNSSDQSMTGENATDSSALLVVTTSSSTATTVASTSTASTSQTTASKYKDGTYSSTGSYSSPAGAEQVGVSVTLKGDVVTDATFTGMATNPTSKRNQDLFSQGFKAQVVGKNIDSINLTVVNGSSLAPKGFMDALVKIKAQAKA